MLYFFSANSYVVNPILIKCYVHMNQKVISCRVASAVVALEVIFLGKNHSNREAQCLVRKDMGPWTILIAVATPVPASQHKQTNKQWNAILSPFVLSAESFKSDINFSVKCNILITLACSTFKRLLGPVLSKWKFII